MDPHFAALGAFLQWLLGALGKGAFGKVGSHAVEKLAVALGKTSKNAPDAEANARRRARAESVARRLATKQADRIDFWMAKFVAATDQLIAAKDEIRVLEDRIKRLEQDKLLRDVPVPLAPSAGSGPAGVQPNGPSGAPNGG